MSGADRSDWMEWLGDQVPTFGSDTQRRYGFAIGHSIFTPADRGAQVPPPDDRPYAAWLYGAFMLADDAGTHLDTLELNFGSGRTFGAG